MCDRDAVPPAPPKYQGHVDEVNARECCTACSTLKKEIENYIHKDAIIAAYQELGIGLAIGANFQPFDDVPLQVARKVNTLPSSRPSLANPRPEFSINIIERINNEIIILEDVIRAFISSPPSQVSSLKVRLIWVTVNFKGQ